MLLQMYACLFDYSRNQARLPDKREELAVIFSLVRT